MPYIQQRQPFDITIPSADWDGWVNSLEPAQRDAVNGAFAYSAPDTLDADRRRFMAVNAVADHLGKDVAEVSDNFESFYQPAYSADVLKKPELGTDLGGFHAALVTAKQGEKDDTMMRNEAASDAVLAAISQDSALTSLVAWQKQARAKYGDKAAGATGEYLGTYARMMARIAPHLETIREVSASARQLMEDASQNEDALTTRGAFMGLAEKMLAIPARDRPLVMRAIAEQGSKGDRGAFMRILHSAARGAESLGSNAVDAVASMAGTPTTQYTDASFVASAGELKADQATADRADEIREMARDLRAMADGNLDPLDPVKLAGMDLAGSARNVPMTLSAFAGLPGLFAIGAAMRTETEDDLRHSYPELTRQQRQSIATLAAPIQAVTEVISDRLLFGRLPNLKRAFTSPAFSARGIASQLVTRIGIGTGVEVAEEFAQDATPRLIMSLSSALGADVPDVNWKGFFTKFGNDLPELVSVILPIALVGAGVGQLSDYRAGKVMASNTALLEAAGYDNAAEIKAAADAGNWSQAESLMREGWKKVAPKGESPSEVVTEAAQKAFKARIEARIEAAKTEIASMQESAVAAERQMQALEKAGMPAIRKGPDGWSVTTRDGETAQFATWDEASGAALSELNDMEAAQLDSVARMADALTQGQDITEIDLGTRRALSQEGMSEEEAAQAVEVASRLAGVPMDAARVMTTAVLGSNRSEQIDNVRRTVSRIWAGGNVLTVAEEAVEGRLRNGWANGTITKEQALSWVRVAEEATGMDFLGTADDAAVSERALIEGVSAIVTADVLGQRKTGKVAPGAVSRGLAAMAMHGRQAQREATGSARGFLRAWRGFFGQVFARAKSLAKAKKEGRLSEDWQGFLDNLMAVDAQGQFDRQRLAEASAMVSEAGPQTVTLSDGSTVEMAFSLGRLDVPSGTPTFEASNATIVGPATFSIRAFHGTPHKVDKFTTEKIGTGEGAQAYGWGLYFAENSDVAASYAKNLAKVDVSFNDGPMVVYYEDILAQVDGDVIAADALLHARRFTTVDEAINNYDAKDDFEKPRREWLIANRNKITLSASNLYTVELQVDEADLLDWDKPLSEQSEKVKAAIQSQAKDAWKTIQNWTGADYYRRYWNAGFDQDFSSAARQAANSIASLGIPGIKYLDGNSRDSGQGTSNFVIFDESLIKIAEENGTPVTLDASFSLGLQAQDAEYLAAVKAGDMEKTQRMVDEAAKEAGGVSIKSLKKRTDLFWRVHGPEFNRGGSPFAIENASSSTLDGESTLPGYSSFPSADDLADYWSGNNFAGRTISDDAVQVIAFTGEKESKEGADGEPLATPDMQEVYRMSFGAMVRSKGYSVNGKSADPVTYDEQGNVIPLSQRFNSDSDDIRFSLAPRALADAVAPDIEQRVASLRPEQKRALWRVAKDRLAGIRDRLAGISESNRTVASLNRERQYRLRSRQRELIDDAVASMSPDEMHALEEGVTKWHENERLAALFPVRLMSRTQAERSGKYDPAKHGDYDGAPGWLPPSFFSAKGGMMPYQLAQAAYDTGLISSPDVGAFWDAVNSEIDRMLKGNEKARAAAAKLGEAKAKAKDQARKEADAWHAKALKDKPSPKDMAIAALRTLDAILSAMPAEVRGKVGGYVQLAQLGTDAAREKELQRRFEILDAELERYLVKEYRGQIEDLLEKARADYSAGKKAKGKLGPEAHHLFAAAEAAAKMTPLEVEAAVAGLDAKIASGELSAQEEQLATEERALVELVGAMYPTPVWTGQVNKKGHPIRRTVSFTGADSVRLDTILSALDELYTDSRLAWRKREIERKEARQARRDSLRSDTGAEGTATERDKRAMEDHGLGPWSKKMVLSLLNFEQALRWVFGGNSAEARLLADGERLASNRKADEIAGAQQALDDLFTSLGGSRYEGERIRWRLAQKSIEAGGRTLSPLEAITATLMWRQEDGRRHMEGTRDEDGKVTSAWSYDQAFIDKIEAALDGDARAVRSFLAAQYAEEYDRLNPVYRRLNGVDMPHNENYSPITVVPGQAKAGQTIDPVTGQVFQGASVTPGSLRTRSRSAVAEPDFRDALQTYVGHRLQMAHWTAYAEFATEAQAVLGNRELGNSVEAAANKQAIVVLRDWVDYFASGGTRDASAHLETVRQLGRWTGRAASIALVGRLGTLMVQATQLGAAAAKMPLGAYAMRLGKLFAGRLGWGAAFRSEYIQRRLAEMPPIVRQALEGLQASEPSRLKHEIARLGRLIGGADALFTAGTYAIVYDYQLKEAGKLGMTGAEAEEFAATEAERAVDEVAQPTRVGARSLLEVRATNPAWRLAWAFASEGRKNLGLVFAASRGSKTDLARAALYTMVINAGLSALIRAMWADARDDGDDEVFDERHWSASRLLMAIGTEWMNGIPVVGKEAQAALYALAGQWMPQGSLLSGSTRAAGELTDGTVDLGDLDAILSAAGVFNDSIAAAASVAHLLKDAAGVMSNATK